MRLVDTRRLTGPNHLARTPLVLVEIGLDEGELLEPAVAAYGTQLARMRVAVGLSAHVVVLQRSHVGGAVFGYEAPIDVMLVCAEISEWAVESAVEVLGGRPAHALEPKRTEIEAMLAHHRRPRLLALVREAAKRNLPLLWDDAQVSLGTGSRSVSFANDALPEIDAVAWGELGAIPTALVTGTNGKTTSSRLLARIATEAGLCVGITSTGGIAIGTEVIEDGDWTGPAAARIVLRRRDVELAVLETARGGILRRGLAVDTCDVALITNVSDDHIGLYGIDDVASMADVKGVVAEAVGERGTAVLNARDPRLVALAGKLTCNVTFFADLEGTDGAARAVVAEHRARGKRVVVAEAGEIRSILGDHVETVVRVDALPITFGGSARYNVENVLGAVACAEALGLARAAVVQGLEGFAMQDNPGRGQITDCDGVTVVLDFGHNPEGVRAVMQLVASLRAKRGPGKLTVVTGSPGDRSDQEILDVAQILGDVRPDRVFVRELADYARGRAPGDVPALFRRSLFANGLREAAFAMATSEVDALERAFEDAVSGDFIVVLVHLDEAEVQAFLRERSAR